MKNMASANKKNIDLFKDSVLKMQVMWCRKLFGYS